VQDIVQFIIHHWLLSSLFLVLLILLLIEEARAKGLMGQVSPQELVRLMNRESAVVIDIRNRDAYQQEHIIGALNFPQPELEKDLSKLNKYKEVPLIIVCATGQKSGELAAKLKKQNFEKVQVLSRGMNAWKSAGMPVVKG